MTRIPLWRREARPRRNPTAAEQAALAEQCEAERLGRVAVHHGKPRGACPYPGGQLRELWLKGYDLTYKRGLRRPDMSPARSAGFYAFVDGLHSSECPYGSRTRAAEQWYQEWKETQRRQEKDDDHGYR
jgi:ribosome modulation factor